MTVGGIITEAKRIRTRNGDHMMFATLDDLAGSVELLVFGKALGEHEAALAVDEVVLVKGRVDHKEAGKTCVVVQSVERFAPSEEEIEQARARRRDAAARGGQRAGASRVHLRVVAHATSRASAIEELKQVIEDFPGRPRCVLEIDDQRRRRRLRLGEGYRVQHTPALRAELEHALRAAARGAAARRSSLQRAGGRGARAARREPALAQPHRERDFLGDRALAASRRASRARTAAAASAGRRQERGAAALAELALRRCSRGGRGWSRAASASR